MAEKQDAFKLTAREQFILDQCVRIEEKCAGLYRHFEKLHAEIPELATLWHNIAREEDSHAESFRLSARLKGVGIEHFNNCDTTVALVNEIDDYLDANRLAKPSPVEALSFAINMERKLGEFHIGKSVLVFNDAALEKAFIDNVHWCKEHVATLEKALERMV